MSQRSSYCQRSLRGAQCHCSECHQDFASPRNKQQYTRETHSDSIICKLCTDSIKSTRGMRRHLHVVHFICKHCNHPCQNAVGLRNHLLKVHELNSPSFSCPVCHQGFASKFNLQRHSVLHDPNRQMLDCEYSCGKTFKSREGRRKHHMKCHLRRVSPQVEFYVTEPEDHPMEPLRQTSRESSSLNFIAADFAPPGLHVNWTPEHMRSGSDVSFISTDESVVSEMSCSEDNPADDITYWNDGDRIYW